MEHAGEPLCGGAIVGLILTAGGLMQLILSSRQTGRVSGMFVPAEALAAFVLWYMFIPDQGQFFLSSATQTALTGLGFVLATLGVLLVRRNDAGLKELFAILPGAAALGGAAVLIKMMILPTMLPHAAFTFVFVAYAVMAVLMGFVALIRKEADQSFFDTKLVQVGVMTGIFSVSAFICFIYSLSYAPNPAYPVLLLMAVPVWLSVYRGLRKKGCGPPVLCGHDRVRPGTSGLCQSVNAPIGSFLIFVFCRLK